MDRIKFPSFWLDPEVIQELMGHADIKTTEIYVEPFDEEVLRESQQAAINATK